MFAPTVRLSSRYALPKAKQLWMPLRQTRAPYYASYTPFSILHGKGNSTQENAPHLELDASKMAFSQSLPPPDNRIPRTPLVLGMAGRFVFL